MDTLLAILGYLWIGAAVVGLGFGLWYTVRLLIGTGGTHGP